MLCDRRVRYHGGTALPKSMLTRERNRWHGFKRKRQKRSSQTKGHRAVLRLSEGPFLAIAVLATYMRVTHLYVRARCVSVCARDQERELLMLPAPAIRVSAPVRNIGRRVRDPHLRVGHESEQSVNFKHRKWEFPITTKVRAANF